MPALLSPVGRLRLRSDLHILPNDWAEPTRELNKHMSLTIGPVVLSDPVVLAPMSGITDLPFRRLVQRFGVGLTVSEMIASGRIASDTRRTATATAGADDGAPWSIQLAGCEPQAMAEAAKHAVDLGAAIIDINFGCPAKKVTNGQAGSALMRDERHAARLMQATVNAVSVPVTVKMRTGWDERCRNAPALARIAEDCGIGMIAVHGRTRCQFYKGRADWRFIAEVVHAVGVPVVANGDVGTVDDAVAMLRVSGADGAMVGRGALGRPWFPAQVAARLRGACPPPEPDRRQRLAIAIEHYREILRHNGKNLGVRIARKHLSRYLDGIPGAAVARARIVRLDEADAVVRELRALLRDGAHGHGDLARAA